MKAIMVMFDSLNRYMLPPYGCDWVHAPNFQRLSEKTVTFDNAYVGSMPCMPARRELHTGRYNFLHRSWGPLEPFDDSMPELLKKSGIHTHLSSDHYHYWEDGGCTYHNRYSSWEASRGQEGDSWIGDLNQPKGENPNQERTKQSPATSTQDWINRQFIREEKEWPQAKTFANGVEFIKRNHNCDKWFLHIETFDPHEPYYIPEKYLKLYDYDYNKIQNDWPRYIEVNERDELSEHYRYLNAALISMCDEYLGKIIDMMDEFNLWEDTMLIVNTDHGFLLGEHDWWGKTAMPLYEEIAHIPLFIYDPRSKIKGQRRKSLVQTIDLPATLLDYFGVPAPEDMQGISLRETIAHDAGLRKAGLFGYHGKHINCTDGRYVYMLSEDNNDIGIYEYTQMPTHMTGYFSIHNLKKAELTPAFDFTKECPLMKIPARHSERSKNRFGTLLFDLKNDPGQEHPIQNCKIEQMMKSHILRLMKENAAPEEQYERMGL